MGGYTSPDDYRAAVGKAARKPKWGDASICIGTSGDAEVWQVEDGRPSADQGWQPDSIRCGGRCGTTLQGWRGVNEDAGIAGARPESFGRTVRCEVEPAD